MPHTESKFEPFQLGMDMREPRVIRGKRLVNYKGKLAAQEIGAPVAGASVAGAPVRRCVSGRSAGL